MDKLVIVGTSGHAKVIIDIVQKQNTYELIGFLDPFKEKGFCAKYITGQNIAVDGSWTSI
tara:strand:- start:120 stop:299 length:180 start_codon:yes stop_codon:yes gene_type:complete